MQGIYRAARDCDVDALRGELLAGVSPDLINENCGRSAFHIVCDSDPSREQVACFNLLIEHGASVHVRDIRGDTSLHFASFFHNVPLVRKLIELGADIDASGYGECTPLHVTCFEASFRTALLLLSAGADVNARCENGSTALEISLEEHNRALPGSYRMYPILLRAGADLPAETDHPYIQKVIDAGGWARYESLHLDKLTAMLTPTPTPADGRRRSRRRLSPLRRLPPEVLRRIVAFAFHVGYY